jgi:hypothetical protein
MWDGVRSPDSKGMASSFTRRHAMKGNGTKDKEAQTDALPSHGVKST